MPDSWIAQFQGNAQFAAASGVTDDPDLDGQTNLEEFLAGTDPTDANSRLLISSFDGETLDWLAKEFTLYELQKSSDLVNWVRIKNILTLVETVGSVDSFVDNQQPKEFYRIVRIP